MPNQRLRRLQRNASTLLALAQSTEAVRRSVLSQAKKDLVLALVECARNIITGRVPLTSYQHGRLATKKTALRRLASSKGNAEEKRRILQEGGFLPFLLAPLAPLLGKLIAGAL